MLLAAFRQNTSSQTSLRFAATATRGYQDPTPQTTRSPLSLANGLDGVGSPSHDPELARPRAPLLPPPAPTCLSLPKANPLPAKPSFTRAAAVVRTHHRRSYLVRSPEPGDPRAFAGKRPASPRGFGLLARLPGEAQASLPGAATRPPSHPAGPGSLERSPADPDREEPAPPLGDCVLAAPPPSSQRPLLGRTRPAAPARRRG